MPGMIDQDKNSAGICYLARFTEDIGYDIMLLIIFITFACTNDKVTLC